MGHVGELVGHAAVKRHHEDLRSALHRLHVGKERAIGVPGGRSEGPRGLDEEAGRLGAGQGGYVQAPAVRSGIGARTLRPWGDVPGGVRHRPPVRRNPSVVHRVHPVQIRCLHRAGRVGGRGVERLCASRFRAAQHTQQRRRKCVHQTTNGATERQRGQHTRDVHQCQG
jgi:hypothetical protein